ncbi:MAG: acyltransferase [Deltaproteobacteria bacterium]|nr:acyltransferase [Deltaproteobacteria bacterium]MCL4873867.1 acyltransferase [bacterium]
MFGIFRYVLALAVAFDHLWPFAGGNNIGNFAVFAFYMLSGYLMTLVLNEKYGFDLVGLTKYFVNRFFRIYPPLIFVGFLTLPLLWFIPVNDISPGMKWPATAYDWFKNITLFDIRTTDIRVVPVSWSLFVEVFYYIAIGLVFARRRWITIAWFAASLLYTGYMLYTGTAWYFRYFTIPASSLPFSMGAILYFYKDRISAPSWLLPVAASALAFNYVYWHIVPPPGRFMTGFYLNLALTSVIIFALSKRKSGYYDQLLGDHAYAIFLCHIGLAVAVNALTGAAHGPMLFFATLPFVLLYPFLSTYLIERNLKPLRDRIRPASSPSPISQGRVFRRQRQGLRA